MHITEELAALEQQKAENLEDLLEEEIFISLLLGPQTEAFQDKAMDKQSQDKNVEMLVMAEEAQVLLVHLALIIMVKLVLEDME
jgi:hypothetical protein